MASHAEPALAPPHPIAGAAPGALRVSYFYDLPLPTHYAAPIQYLNTCHALARLGVPTTVYVGRITTHDYLAPYGLTPHERLRVVPLFSRLPGRPELRWRLRRIVSEQRTSGAHVLISRGETGIALLPRLRRLGLPASTRIVYEAHRLGYAHEAERLTRQRWSQGDPLPRRAMRVRGQERDAVAAADGLLCLTAAVRSALEQSFGVTVPALVLPSGVTLPSEATIDAPTDNTTLRDIDVLFAGKLEVRKGVELLIAAMAHLPERSLWIVGGTPAQVEGCRRLAGEHGVAGRVHLTGFVEPAQVPTYLRRARVGVCPLPTGESVISEEFTSPLKLLELMAHGVPVVSTDVPSVRAIVNHDGAERVALLVQPDDPRALANGIGSVLRSPALATSLGAAGRQRAAFFSWEARAQRLLDFLTLLTHSPARHQP